MGNNGVNITQTDEYYYLKLLTTEPYNERLTTAVTKAKDRAVCHGFDLDKIDAAVNEILK